MFPGSRDRGRISAAGADLPDRGGAAEVVKSVIESQESSGRPGLSRAICMHACVREPARGRP